MTPATPSNPTLPPILSDQPAYSDQLDFAPYAKTLSDIVSDPSTRTPLTIGVFGGWGQGKTSLMHMVQRRLQEQTDASRQIQTVWFNAWLYGHQPALWRALISRALDGARGFSTLGEDARPKLNQRPGPQPGRATRTARRPRQASPAGRGPSPGW